MNLPLGSTLYFVFVFLLGVGAFRYAIRNWHTARFYRSAKQEYIPTWHTFDEFPMPVGVQAGDERLRQLGYIPLGASHDVHPKIKLDVIDWHYLNSDGTILVELVPYPNAKQPLYVTFITRFSDDALLLTTFPRGVTLQSADLHIRFARYRIAAAHDYHVKMVEQWRELHGEPVAITDTHAVDRLGMLYNEKYKARANRVYIQSHTLITVIMGITAAALMLSALGIIVLPQFRPIAPLISSVIIVLFFPFAVFFLFLLPAWLRRQLINPTLAVDADQKPAAKRRSYPPGQHPIEAETSSIEV